MRNRIGILWVFVISAVACNYCVGAGPTNVIPPLKYDNFSLQVNGVTRVISSTEKLTDDDRFDWQNQWIMLSFKTPDPKLTAFVQLEAVNADKPESNWLRQGYVAYQLTEKWLARGGRLFLAAPYYTTPPLFAVETAHFSHEPWNYYGTGIQVEGNFGDGWSLIADVTGKSATPFDRSESFDRMETSGRLEKELSDSLSVGGLYQLSEDFVRGGMDFHWKSEIANVYGEVYAAHDNGIEKDVCGGYVVGSYKLTKNILPHIQLDYQHADPDGDSVIITPGILFRTDDDRMRFVVDYEWHSDNSDASGVYAVLQFRF